MASLATKRKKSIAPEVPPSEMTFWAYSSSDVLGQPLVLLDNVQFIYELALAGMELQALGVSYRLKENLREFECLSSVNANRLIRRCAYLKSVQGQYTDYYRLIQHNRTRSVNQYLTHWIYPYKGKFHPQMIRALLNILHLEPGQTVLDPFIGSGTTALEAQLLGIDTVGIDISPLCVLQGRVKTESVEALDEIVALKEKMADQMDDTFFGGKKDDFLQVVEQIDDQRVRNFYKMAYLVAVSDQARRGKALQQAFYKNLDAMLQSVADMRQAVKELNLSLGKVNIYQGDCRKLSLKTNSVDGIITSPPYSIALDYVDNDAHALEALGCSLDDIRQDVIGVRGKNAQRIDLYNRDMRQAYQEMYRVLKPGRMAAIVIGNATYGGQEVKTVEMTIEVCQQLGFKLLHNIDKIIFGLYNVMQKENILIFQK